MAYVAGRPEACLSRARLLPGTPRRAAGPYAYRYIYRRRSGRRRVIVSRDVTLEALELVAHVMFQPSDSYTCSTIPLEHRLHVSSQLGPRWPWAVASKMGGADRSTYICFAQYIERTFSYVTARLAGQGNAARRSNRL